MKRSLALLALQFPPIGGGYSERIAGFAKFWCRESDLDLHVICAKPDGLGMPIDKSGEAEIAKASSITRLTTISGWMNSGFIGKIAPFRPIAKVFSKLIPVDHQLPWSLAAGRHAERLYKEGKISAILTSSTPYSVHVAGLRLKRRHPDLRWIADFRDPWTTNYQHRFIRRLPFSKTFHKWLEQAVYDKADAVIINTHQNLNDLDGPFRIDRCKMHVIQNGYDPELDFSVSPLEPRVDGEFRLGFIGGSRGDWFEGPLHRAIAHLKKADPQAYQQLQVPLIGTSEVKGSLPTRLGIADRLKPQGFVERRELGSRVSGLDALVLILPDNNERPLGWVPQRLYLFLATGLPILCIAPEGEAATYVRESGHGTVVAPSETAKISEILSSWIASPPQPYPSYHTPIRKFSKSTLATKLLALIFPDERLGGQSRMIAGCSSVNGPETLS
ncbi:glycosyltransferase [Psychromarinibacter sp. C21-152]|uniref:Glycosyltransferase n=1 Tax=Psychromarinibacter sediminicola TaxID=3033385 RepID=A0AAE3NZL0_9RHOB|nr:glycosyltransferase [Psychromarinibacter sediminicola]MDF0603617.1 glycosyltransferase [Psychromarinibacter sediminicola]